MGLPFLSLMDVLDEADDPPDILKLGIVYPLPEQTILEFLKTHQEVKILEELDDLLEKEIKALAYDRGLGTKIIGKMDIQDWLGEYSPDKVFEVLRKTWPDLLPAPAPAGEEPVAVPWRPAQLCPGCGHRSAFHAIKKALKSTDNHGGRHRLPYPGLSAPI